MESISAKPPREFKHKDKSFENIRLFRNKITVHLRKEKRQESYFKYRNLPEDFEDDLNTSISFEELINEFFTSDENKRIRIMSCFRRKISKLSKMDKEFSQHNRKIMQFLISSIRLNGEPEVQYEAAWALVNTSSESTAHVNLIMESGGMEGFFYLLGSPSNQHREIAIWGIGNLIGSSDEIRNTAIKYNFIELIWRIIQLSTTTECHSRIAWVMVSICTRLINSISQETLNNIVNILLFLIKNENVIDIYLNTSTAILMLLESLPLFIDVLILYGFIPILVRFLNLKSEIMLCTVVVRIFGTIASGNETQTQSILDCGIFKHIPEFIRNPNPHLRKEVLWLLTNISAGSPAQKQYIIQYNILPDIIKHLRLRNEYTNQKEASWVLCNILKNSNITLIEVMIKQDILSAMLDILIGEDIHLLVLTLSSITSMFKCIDSMGSLALAMILNQYNAINIFEKLQYNQNESISGMATHIVENYLSKTLNAI